MTTTNTERRPMRLRSWWPALLLGFLVACGQGTDAASQADAAPQSGAAEASEPASDAPIAMVMHYDPGCGCCSDWAAYMREEGFELDMQLSDNIAQTRRDLGVPGQLASCHTTEVDGYLVEGHVPADAVRQLLEERPDALGISAPGMPFGSPGMEVGDRVDEYPVVLFDAEGNTSLYVRYYGHQRL